MIFQLSKTINVLALLESLSLLHVEVGGVLRHHYIHGLVLAPVHPVELYSGFTLDQLQQLFVKSLALLAAWFVELHYDILLGVVDGLVEGGPHQLLDRSVVLGGC